MEDWSKCVQEIAQERNKERFEELFKHFGPRLKQFFIRMGSTTVLADDLTQETMVNVWRKAEYFDPLKGGAATWIFTIARNLRTDHVRRQRDPNYLAEFLYEQQEQIPGAELLAIQRDEHVRAALQLLPKDQEAVIRLSFFEGQPHPEIADRLAIPLGTVKSRLRLAMRRLRSLVERE